MKAVHLIGGGDVGGAKTHVLSLIAGLGSFMQVTLVSFREGPFAEEARAMGIDVRVITEKNPIAAYQKLKALALSEKFELIHSHGARGNMMAALLGRGLRLPSVTTVHSDYRLDYMGRLAGRLTYGVINKVALRFIDYHIGVSRPVSDMLIDRGFAADRLFTIYNGLDFAVRARDFDRFAFLRACGMEVSAGDVVAGIAARLSPVKDISTLLSAFARARANVPNLRLLIAGDGEIAPQLKKQAQRLGIAGQVCFAGWLSDIDAFYRAIDINLLTSLSETFPYAITEGARMGRATISSRVGGVPELIDSGVNGFLFKPGDVSGLAECLERLSASQELRLTFGARLREKAERDFSLKAMIERQLSIYASILRRAARPKMKREGVTICGAYGYGNAGDDAILEAILEQMRALDPDIPIRVLSRRPKLTKKSYKVHSLYTFNPFALFDALRRSRLYINGGGSLIQDVTSSRSLFFYLYTIVLARLCGCRVMMYGCGIGPVLRRVDRLLSAHVMNRNVDVITLREDNSLEELTKMGVTRPEIYLSADPTLTLSRAGDETVVSHMLSQGLPPQGDYICFALRLWPGFDPQVFARAAQLIYEKHALTPVFLPIEPQRDLKAADMAAAFLSCPYYILRDSGGARVAMGMLSRTRVMVSMRLHALMFAAAQGVPLVGAVYDYKVSAFLRYIGQDLFCPLSELTTDKLVGFIEAALERSGGLPMLSAVNHLREKANINTRQAARLLGFSAFSGGMEK